MFSLQILGSSAAAPTTTRRPTAQVLSYRDRYYLLDCGEGTQMQLFRYRIRFARLDAIFISHMHGDHVFGLPGLLTTLSLYGRNQPLRLYGPAALKKSLDFTFAQSQSHLSYELEFFALEDFELGSIIFETRYLRVKSLPLDHRIFCRGFLFEEINKQPKFDFYKAKGLEIPNVYFKLLKQGNRITLDDGRDILPEMVLLPPEAPVSYAYCSDTGYHEALVAFIRQATLLYHEATFLEDLRERADETRHSTARDAARIAAQAAVNTLLLGHFSARYRELDGFLEEARAIFPRTELATEGRIFKFKDYVAEAQKG